ncbi:hypothetical protein [Variovorax sp. PvP013]|uniref:hypothetical protein n=1 Tax=Variovorax sp. PvP013 TaxID=3156435 RepID=UPI003D22BB46
MTSPSHPPSPTRSSGERRSVRHIGLHRFAQLRAVAEGLDVAACAARYQTPSTGPIIGQPLPSLSRW